MLERQREGIEIARQKGKYKGRKSNFSDDDVQQIKKEFSKSTNNAKLARQYGMTRSYLYRIVKKAA